MAIKFRNSLFGFNKDDVLECVVAMKSAENTLKSKIQNLEKELSEQKKLNEEISAQIKDLSSTLTVKSAELEEYHAREESLIKLGESIGKMYLVSQANAKSVLDSVNDSIKKADEIISAKIEVASKAEEDFASIRQILNEKTDMFNNEVLELQDKLYRTKISLKENTQNAKESAENIEELVSVTERR